ATHHHGERAVGGTNRGAGRQATGLEVLGRGEPGVELAAPAERYPLRHEPVLADVDPPAGRTGTAGQQNAFSGVALPARPQDGANLVSRFEHAGDYGSGTRRKTADIATDVRTADTISRFCRVTVLRPP